MTDSLHTRAASRLQLNPREKQLRGLLLDVAAFIDRSQGPGTSPERAFPESMVLRWAGGWVRDKILGTDSHDIDVAINNMTGYSFATKMQEFCNVPENRARHSMSENDLGNLYKVKKNPEKSKNLETGTTTLFGLEVDFVNLRKEVYSGDSRNPEMEFGTAEEDAERRDATINALFFNLNTGELEDFTGGLRDMEARVMRTPLEPFKTFWDDPLRVLRLVRFAARLDFTIDSATEKAMADSRIVERFRVVITRERVGIEVDKMLKGKRPREALELIDKIGLYHVVFTDPVQSDVPKPDTTNWARVYDCLNLMSRGKSASTLYETLVLSAEEEYLAWVIAALVPWEQMPDPASRSKKKPFHWTTLAAREGIKAPNVVTDLLTAAHENRPDIVALKNIVCNGEDAMHERDRFGMAVRQWDRRSSHWRLQILYAALVDIFETADSASEGGRTRVLDGWQKFVAHLEKLNVMDAPSTERLIDGKQLAAALGVPPGPWMTKAIDVCLAWQLRNPQVTDPAGAIEEVERRKDELGIGGRK